MSRLRSWLIEDEGVRLKPYRCTEGRLTIGIGRNLDDAGISLDEAYILLANDIERVHREAVENFAWFKSISTVRQDVVLAMIFQLGLDGFKEFKKTIQAIANGHFDRAADEMLSSLWARQTPKRAQKLAKRMRTGRE